MIFAVLYALRANLRPVFCRHKTEVSQYETDVTGSTTAVYKVCCSCHRRRLVWHL